MDSRAANRRVLVVGRDTAVISALLTEVGYGVTQVRGPAEARAELARRHHDAVILDAVWQAAEGTAMLRGLRRAAPGAAVLVVTEADRAVDAVRALPHGADDYLLRPANRFELKMRLGRLLDQRDLDSRVSLLQDELARKKFGHAKPVGRSPAMARVLERVARVAPMRSTVLIHGESGVGKELVARAIHFNSPRRERSFVAINCAAIPGNLIESELFGHERGSFTGAHTRLRGKFELADGGTLFLDEIGEMNAGTQAKLLRILEEKEFMRIGGDQSIHVDVRVIAATNADLDDLVSRRLFRRDLYYRLKVVTIDVPPLRQRAQDIPVLIETFLDELSRANAVPRKTVAPEALEALASYAWPGNVRELKNTLESVLVSLPGDSILLDDLPAPMRQGRQPEQRFDPPAGITLAEMERQLIARTLEHTGGNRTHSAELLGIGVRTLQRKIRLYGIDVAPTRRRRRSIGDERPA